MESRDTWIFCHPPACAPPPARPTALGAAAVAVSLPPPPCLSASYPRRAGVRSLLVGAYQIGAIVCRWRWQPPVVTPAPSKKSLVHARTLGGGGGEGTGHVAESTPVNAAQGRCVTCQRLRAPPCSATGGTGPIALPPPQCARGSGAFHQTTAAVSTRCGSCQRVVQIRGRGGGAHCPNQGRPALCS